MDKLGISFCDEYETLLAEYLKSGTFEIEAVAKTLDRYADEANGLATRNRIGKLLELGFWSAKGFGNDHPDFESLSGILCARHSMTTRSIYANKQDEDEERGDRGQVRGAAQDPQGTA